MSFAQDFPTKFSLNTFEFNYNKKKEEEIMQFITSIIFKLIKG